jgi:hypothetical protein
LLSSRERKDFGYYYLFSRELVRYHREGLSGTGHPYHFQHQELCRRTIKGAQVCGYSIKNINRRHLDDFQKAEVALRHDKLAQKIAAEHHEKTKFTSETGKATVTRRWSKENEGQEDEEEIPSVSVSTTTTTTTTARM